MSDITDTFEDTWKILHEIVVGANCVSVGCGNNSCLNFDIYKGRTTSRVEIPKVALSQDSYEP